MKGGRLRQSWRLLWLIGLSGVLLLAPQDLGAQSGWFQFTLPWADGSPSFLSYPSGGPVTEPIRVGTDGHLHLGSAGGPRVRLFGMTLPQSLVCATSSRAEKTAARLAKFGFNLVRLFPIDCIIGSLDPFQFNEPELDRMFYLIKQLKDRGIYISISLIGYGFRWDRPSGIFMPGLIAAQKNEAKQLLSRINPHTGLALKDDPALAHVHFNNETSLWAAFQSDLLHYPPPSSAGEGVSAEESAFLNAEWNKRLRARFGNRETLREVWQQGCPAGKISLEDSEDPVSGTVKRIKYSQWASYCPKRLIDEVTFYFQLENEFVENFYNFLTIELGLQVPITTMHNFYGIPNKMAQAKTNAMAQNNPWAHPWPFPRGFMDPPFTFLNWPMTKGPASGTPPQPWVEWKNTIWKGMVTNAVQGKPYLVTEYNHPLPNEFQAEFPLLIAAYAAFQGWDAIILHEYANRYAPTALAPGEVGSSWIEQGFELADDPAVMAQVPAAARLFRNGGWVTEGSNTIVVPFWEDGQLDGQDGALNDWWNCLTLYYYCYWDKIKPGGGSFTAKGTVTQSINPAIALERKVRMEFLTSQPSSLPTIPTVSPPYDSDTGELHWDTSRGSFGLVTISSSWVNAAIGSVNTNPQLSTLKLSNTSTDFAAVSIIPLDNQPLASSQKLLLTVAGRLMNTGMNPPAPRSLGQHTFNSWGGPPVLLQSVQAQVTLTLPQAFKIQVYRLDETGNLGTQIPVTKSGNNFTFTIGGHDTLWYGIIVEPAQTEAAFRVTREGDVLADGGYYCGLPSGCFNTGQGADIAERINVSEPVEPGDVVELDPNNPKHYRKARGPYSQLVAGIISTAPGFTLANQPGRPLLPLQALLVLEGGSFALGLRELAEGQPLIPKLTLSLGALEVDQRRPASRWSVGWLSALLLGWDSGSDHRPLLALMGVVPVKATTENGPIRPGDLLVPSSTPGYVMRCDDLEKCLNSIVGKALEALEEGTGMIKVLVMR